MSSLPFVVPGVKHCVIIMVLKAAFKDSIIFVCKRLSVISRFAFPNREIKRFISNQIVFFLKMGQPRPLFHLFCLFKQTFQFLQQKCVKK